MIPTEISGIPVSVYMALLAMGMIAYAMILGARLIPQAAPRPRTVRHEVIFRGKPISIEPAPQWLGERIMTGLVGTAGDTIRVNNSTIGLSRRLAPGTRVAVHIVRA